MQSLTWTRDRLGRHVSALKRCTTCPDMQRPVVTGGAIVSKVLLVGQAPGDKEPMLGRPFAWTAGRTLFRWFNETTGLDEATFRSSIYMAAVCRCFPGKKPRGGDRELLRLARGRVSDPSTRPRDPGRQAGYRAVHCVSVSCRSHRQADAHQFCRPRDGLDPSSSPLRSLPVAPDGARKASAAGCTAPDRQASGPRQREALSVVAKRSSPSAAAGRCVRGRSS